MALQYAYNQRPEVLADLGIVGHPKAAPAKNSLFIILIPLMVWSLMSPPAGFAEAHKGKPPHEILTSPNEAPSEKGSFAGMDESVNETLAEAAGRSARDPYINTEEMGDLWNLLLLSAGGICGFVIGRWWHLLWGKRVSP